MEQAAKYWGMWGGAKTSSSAASTTPGPLRWSAAAAYSSEPPSWEEQAFARDAAADLVWPPRSYSCSFCQREFRSAQALGGHMNVHRRDRARLRQGSSPDDAPHDHRPHQDYSFLHRAISSPSTTTPPSSFLSAIIKEGNKKNKVLMSTPLPMEVTREATGHQVEEEEEPGRPAKRRRVDQPSVALPIFVRSMAAAALVAPCEGVDHDAKVHTSSPSPRSPIADQQVVDLELRLGTTPKVT